MPRQAHGRSVSAIGPSRPRKSKPARGKGLHALEEAEDQFPENVKIRQHRLGEIENDSDTPVNRADAEERSSKRRKVVDQRNEVDEEDGGSDLDGNEWHVGMDEEDEDSDIDSDEAFGESDEEKFADFTFRGSEKQNTKPDRPRIQGKKAANKTLDLTEADLATDEEEESDNSNDEKSQDQDDDDFGDEAVDLATAFDMNDEEDRLDAERIEKKKKRQDDELEALEDSDASNASSDQSSDEESSFSISEDEGPIDSSRLRSFVDSLTPAQKQGKNKMERPNSRGISAKPSQFALSSSKISAADLLPYIKDPLQRQSLKMLQAAENEEPSSYKSGIPGKLSAPLAKRQQDRLDRTAAYDKSKETLDRWVDTVKQNRRAEHVSFPLADPAKDSAAGVKSFQPMLQAAPQSELEAKIQEIMLESGFGTKPGETVEDQEQAYEELQEKKMPLEEVLARRRELRMQRELMFREELRAKRIKKIKSKAYRRVHRKEKDRMAAQQKERLLESGILNSDEEREQNDRRRAEERMGARHRESKWAKGIKATGQAAWNDESRIGVSELARKDEELRRRIDGHGARGSDESESESNSEYDTDTETRNLDEKLNHLGSSKGDGPQSKLAGMAFMQKADALRKQRNDEEIRQLRKSLADASPSASDSDSEGLPASGRQKFGGQVLKQSHASHGKRTEKSEFEERPSEEDDDDDEDKPKVSAFETELQSNEPTRRDTQAPSVKSKAVSQNMPRSQQSGRQLRTIANNSSKPVKHNTSKTSNGTQSVKNLDDYTSSSDSDHEGADVVDPAAALAMDIFAGEDDLETRKQFEKEKKETVEEEGDRVVDNTLPGWGSWAGAGISKREQKKAKGRFLTTVKGIAPEKRQDAKLDRVIINEKRIKKNGKYLANELPHPFESRAQYERSLRLPMGPEWSTRNHFQNAIKPRVLVKQGNIIKPVARPMA